ncbi:MAG TPA: terminase small subunit [Blastocatellia bacterium]|nr:terminase small subunit [Blastocatellia bacterium]
MPRRLTIKQQKFVKEYIENDGNGTKAALAVYETSEPTVANAIATENLQKPSIREKIDEALASLEITPNWVLNRHKTIAEKQEDKDPMVSERALENIGKIAGLYPSATNQIDIDRDGISIKWKE